LRRTSLDELPQLLNILQGNLSLVGPRPLVKNELEEKYGRKQDAFLSVKPGLTGYWQVNGRCDTSYEKRIALELYYVEHASFWLDIKILMRTVVAVLLKVGAK
jgi:lipopolysaccharide/colanic/teichoic acid biosynthesis glycosyltransferase